MTLPLRIVPARSEDAQVWVGLRHAGKEQPTPDEVKLEVERFRSASLDVAESRYLVWDEDAPIACVELCRLGRVVDIRDLAMAADYIHERGVAVVQAVRRLAEQFGSVLTAEYPEAQSRFFLGAGFRQNTRTRMTISLAGYESGPVSIPPGIRMRHPRPEDEPAVAAMAYRNYTGTPDADMVSSSLEQAQYMIRAMFGGAYSRFLPGCSFLAEEESGALVASCLVGDVSREEGERVAWILDISLAEEWRGKGLGRAMLMSSLNAGKEAGFERAGLIVTIGNDRARALYRSLGFEAYGETMYEGVLKV